MYGRFFLVVIEIRNQSIILNTISEVQTMKKTKLQRLNQLHRISLSKLGYSSLLSFGTTCRVFRIDAAQDYLWARVCQRKVGREFECGCECECDPKPNPYPNTATPTPTPTPTAAGTGRVLLCNIDHSALPPLLRR